MSSVTCSFCLWRNADEVFWEISAGPRIDSPWFQLYHPQLGTIAMSLCSVSLHDICSSLVAPRDSSVLHLLMEARSNTSLSLMLAEMVVVLRIPGQWIPFSLSLENPNNLWQQACSYCKLAAGDTTNVHQDAKWECTFCWLFHFPECLGAALLGWTVIHRLRSGVINYS